MSLLLFENHEMIIYGFVVLCFVVVTQSFIMNSHEVFIHIHQGCFACTGAIVRLPQCQWSKPDGYGKTSQCITTTKSSKTKTVCIFLGIYCKDIQCLPLFHDLMISWIQNTLAIEPIFCTLVYQSCTCVGNKEDTIPVDGGAIRYSGINNLLGEIIWMIQIWYLLLSAG